MFRHSEASNPPVPPDTGGSKDQSAVEVKEGGSLSFKEILTAPYSKSGNTQTSSENYQEQDMLIDEPAINMNLSHDITRYVNKEGISLSMEEKQRIYKSWTYSIIIKVIGKALSHLYLKNRLSTLWKVSEEIVRIDLAYDFYIVKFFKQENLQKNTTVGTLVHKWLLLIC